MSIVEKFGEQIEKLTEKNPEKARKLLKTGWSAQDFRFRYFSNRNLSPSDKYLAHIMMETMIAPLKRPERSALVSIFVPCELIFEAGLMPYNVEGFSCYLAASDASDIFLQSAENAGLSETLCSYHKTFIGAAEKGLLPAPGCIVYTNLACDANLVTFKEMADFYKVPSFAIDVPFRQSEANVKYVADQLRELKGFLEKCTGRKIEEESVEKRMMITRRTLEKHERAVDMKKDRTYIRDVVSPLYEGMTANILLGTEEEEKYTEMVLKDLEGAKKSIGKKIYWMHTIPYWSEPVKKNLSFDKNIQIIGCELADLNGNIPEYEDAYEFMAARLVYHPLNGSIQRRIDNGIRAAERMGADGVIWFNHWGCKHTIGSAQLAKRKFEEMGIPFLVLDGDGCDSRHGGEGQTSTRLEAFIEMLNSDEREERENE